MYSAPSAALRSGLRRHRSLLVSGALVLLMGGLGLCAGLSAGQEARQVHRADRLELQERLAGLVDVYVQLQAAEIADKLATAPAWSTGPGDPATERRLEELVAGTRALDAGAVLVGPAGVPLASYSTIGALPDAEHPGWRPLREAVLAADGRLPLSDVMPAGDTHVLALGLPVPLEGGGQGLLVGLWEPAAGGLQTYTSRTEYGEQARGFVVDRAGRVVAAPDPALIGGPLPLAGVRTALVGTGTSGIVETDDEGGLLTTHARAERTGWTALTPQSREAFEGTLVRSARLVQALVVGLLLVAGSSLVVLHRLRERALREVALRDELTGVWNRRGWCTLAEHELERAHRAQAPRVLVFVDVDGLKQVNDALGHREGDRAVRDTATVLAAASRSSDLVGRLGGDEFVLLLGEGGDSQVAARRVQEALAAHNAASSAPFELRLSVGVATWCPDDACPLDELVRRADAVMYADKARPDRLDGVLRVPAQRTPPADRSRV